MFKLIRTLKVKVKLTQNQRVHRTYMSMSVLPMKSSVWKCDIIIHVSICALLPRINQHIPKTDYTLRFVSSLSVLIITSPIQRI